MFDLNTANEGVLQSIPALPEAVFERWASERERHSFMSLADFKARVPGRPNPADCA